MVDYKSTISRQIIQTYFPKLTYLFINHPIPYILPRMSSPLSIIADAKYQQLSTSFTFDEQQQTKLIINAIVDNTPYQLQLLAIPYLSFEDIKNSLVSKQFKIMVKSPEMLKINVGIAVFQFRSVERLTVQSLKQSIKELSSKLEEQKKKNAAMQEGMREFRSQLDFMTTKIAGLCLNDHDVKEQLLQVRHQMKAINLKHEQQSTQITFLQEKTVTNEALIENLKQELKQQKEKNKNQGQKMRNLQIQIMGLTQKSKQVQGQRQRQRTKEAFLQNRLERTITKLYCFFPYADRDI